LPLVATLFAATARADDETDAKAALKRVSYDVQFLASDELKGRGVGTEGIETAAKYIVDEYKKVGLESGVADGSYRQLFEVNLGRQLVKDSVKVVLTGPQGKELVLECGKSCQPMAVGGDSALKEAQLVFVGYGIKADEHNYDEYKNVDVKDKVVVLIRIEPQQQKDDSVFAGKEHSDYARVSNKVQAAEDAGAAGIILVNDGVSAPTDDKDTLLAFDELGRSGKLPFVQIKRETLNEMLAVSPIPNPTGGHFESLAEIEEHIDANLEPISASLSDWTLNFDCRFDSVKAKTANIVGVLRGEGPLADEYVVIGGHYDHLGFGEIGSRAGRREIHNGADDNATGTAAVMELARRYAKYDKKPKRTVVFICFSAEERGLLGAAHYCNQEALFDLSKTVAMINYDMIGWLRDGKLTVFGSGCGSTFEAVLDEAAKGSKLVLSKVPSPFAGSDHMPFYQKNVPVMFLHTGLTDTYHTPEDDFNTLNMSGALDVIDFSEKMIWNLVNRDDKPEFVSAEGGGQARPSFFGVRLDYSDTKDGLKILSFAPESPAQKAGLAVGDLVLEVAGKKITERSELQAILRENKPGTSIAVKYKRAAEEKSVDVQLGEPPSRPGN
jgi:hypothetical protein